MKNLSGSTVTGLACTGLQALVMPVIFGPEGMPSHGQLALTFAATTIMLFLHGRFVRSRE